MRTGAYRGWATAVCLVAVMLPFGPRLVLSRVLGFLSNPSSARSSPLFQRHMRLWNRVVLGFVFVLGFPLARIFYPLWSRSRLSPGPGAHSYWIRRPPPEEFEKGIKDPF
ncbi:MAG: hypothetical protein ISR64_00160 [Deltaproteobacteria bacterium]|nr:hypothetical protein [Deltaproteobacteria bacterium]